MVEKARIIKSGPDLLTFFILMLVIQMVLPGMFLTAVAGLFSGEINIGVPFMDKVLNEIGFYEIALVFILLFLFVLSLYAFWFLVNQKINLQKNYTTKIKITVSFWRWLVVMIMGLIGMWILLKELDGYNNVVFFRSDETGTRKGFVASNLFSLTTTFMMLSVVGMIMFWKKKISVKFLFSLGCFSVFALMTASRRAFMIGFLLIFFTLALWRMKIDINKSAIIAVLLFIPIVIYGKSVLWLLAHNLDITIEAISLSSENILLSGSTLFMANIGISTIESWATLLYLDIPLRFGIDHVLSIARRIPDGIMGLDITFPERMVRISTQAFVGSDRQDVPPGLIGQMWLDFGLFGPIIWGMFFCLIIALLQTLYNRVEKDCAGVSLFVLLIYTVSLPINSGTFDFVFSVNVFFLMMFIIFMIKIKKRRVYD